jgi:hypothetical protein
MLPSVSPAAVSRRKMLSRRIGSEGLKATPHPRPKPKVTPARPQKLERMLLEGPLSYGYLDGPPEAETDCRGDRVAAAVRSATQSG